MILTVILGRGAGLLSIPPLCLRCILSQVDRSIGQDGFPGTISESNIATIKQKLTFFQEVMMFLQALPTKGWTEKDIELLLSEAFIWQSLFQDSRAHLRPAGDEPPENGIFY